METSSTTSGEPAPDVSSPEPRKRFYKPELDVLRFLAFFLILLHHSNHGGSPLLYRLQDICGYGLCLFFLLSSFLITELLAREAARTRDVHIQSFYMRRILRIWPLYLGYILLWVAIDHFSQQPISKPLLASFLLLSGNWYFALQGFQPVAFGHLWSISVEEQFYLLWPSLYKHGRRRAAIVASLLSIPVAFATLAWLCRTGHPDLDAIWTNSFVQFLFFAAGALLSALLKGNTPSFTTLQRLLLLLASAVLVLIAQFGFRIHDPPPGWSASLFLLGYLCVAGSCASLLLAFYGSQAIGRLRVLAYLGRISYGLYVFHFLGLQAAGFLFATLRQHLSLSGFHPILFITPVSLAITAAIASASYFWFEMPFLKLKERFSFIQSRRP